MPDYEYAVRVHPWGQKLGRNIRGRVWVPAPDETLAEERVRTDLSDRYGDVVGEDIVNIQLSLIEEAELEEEVRY
jgi:hypothetical protein